MNAADRADNLPNTTDDTVAHVGEQAVLERVLAKLGVADAAIIGPGDDSAVLRLSGDLTVTSDTMIEGTDFRLDWHTSPPLALTVEGWQYANDGWVAGQHLGFKLAATNLSDIAAMGALPVGLTVSIACPGDSPVALLEGFAVGLTLACETLAPGCAVVGGDLSSSPVLMVAVTGLGDCQGRGPVTRAGAQPGDVLAYAGDLGLSGTGLALLLKNLPAPGNEHAEDVLNRLTAEHPAAIAAHLAPTPPIAAGIAAADAGATAMLDVSDGLSIDAARLARASGVTCDLDTALLEQRFGTQFGEEVSVEMMLSGGEDHGLLATFPANVSLPKGFVQIGNVLPARQDGAPLMKDGEPIAIRGWDSLQHQTLAEE